MPFNESLADRIRPLLAGMTNFDEKKMFGGVGFMVGGNMCCGIHKDYLILRLGPKKAEKALQLEHCRVFDITGRPMKGWVMIDREGYDSDPFLTEWIGQCYQYVTTLPPK